MSENRNRDGQQKGAQEHAEGQHGSKAHSRMIEQLNSGESAEEREAREMRGARVEADGKHRLYEDREQHDEAEKNSERNRSAVEADRGREPTDAQAHRLRNAED
jgi:hypothetical protein